MSDDANVIKALLHHLGGEVVLSRELLDDSSLGYQMVRQPDGSEKWTLMKIEEMYPDATIY